ncbi:hypothetical protein ACFVIY_41815 [Streptomyces sp. NPDC127166]|uniref:hypothetical protein n=1 Tax=Streptomyces sp. NPDC127166 TaxID=3345380 RepID=UPI003642A926
MSDRIEHVRVPQTSAPTVFMAGPEGLAVIDMIAVERAVTGHRDGARLTEDEARYAASLLLAESVPFSVAATLVGINANRLRGWFPELAAIEVRRSIKHQPAPCGTRRGYQAHKRRGEDACIPCLTANRLADQRYRLTGSHSDVSAVAA